MCLVNSIRDREVLYCSFPKFQARHKGFGTDLMSKFCLPTFWNGFE